MEASHWQTANHPERSIAEPIPCELEHPIQPLTDLVLTASASFGFFGRSVEHVDRLGFGGWLRAVAVAAPAVAFEGFEHVA